MSVYNNGSYQGPAFTPKQQSPEDYLNDFRTKASEKIINELVKTKFTFNDDKEIFLSVSSIGTDHFFQLQRDMTKAFPTLGDKIVQDMAKTAMQRVQVDCLFQLCFHDFMDKAASEIPKKLNGKSYDVDNYEKLTTDVNEVANELFFSLKVDMRKRFPQVTVQAVEAKADALMNEMNEVKRNYIFNLSRSFQ